jgi:hypothetical protein
MLKYKLRSSSLLLIYSEFDRAQSMRGLELVISSNQITQRFVQNIKFLQHSYIFFEKIIPKQNFSMFTVIVCNFLNFGVL